MLYIGVKFHENISNDIRVMERTQNYEALMDEWRDTQISEGITHYLATFRKGTSIWDHYLQCPKVGNSKSRQFRGMVLVFCTSYHGNIHLHKISRKYLKQFSSYRVDTYICILQKSLFSMFNGP